MGAGVCWGVTSEVGQPVDSSADERERNENVAQENVETGPSLPTVARRVHRVRADGSRSVAGLAQVRLLSVGHRDHGVRLAPGAPPIPEEIFERRELARDADRVC